MSDQLDKTWDRADFAGEMAWAEMYAFLRKCEADGPPKTPEERDAIGKQFLEIQERCHARIKLIFDRAVAGDPAPHLRRV